VKDIAVTPEQKLEALKANYELCAKNVKACEEELEVAHRVAKRAYAALDDFLNRAEREWRDTDAEGY